jgi:O-antigen ligase
VTVATERAGVERFPAASRGSLGRHGVRAVSMLTVYLVLLLAIPSSATITALGSLGRPSMIWGVVMLLWWVIAKLQTRVVEVRPLRQPVRFAFLTFFVIVLISFAVAMLRGQPADQVSPAFTALVRLLSWAGVLLITVDGIRTRGDLERILRRIGIGAGLLAALGIVQFITKSSLLDFFASIPGITMPFFDVAERGGVSRVPGTAIHPLEYATVLNAALPLVIAAAISHGFHWKWTKGRIGWWIPVALISLSALIGVSRSAIIGFAVAALTMIPILPRLYRGIVIVGGLVLAAGAVIAIPGLLKTTLNLFAGASSDPSTQSRTGGLARAPEFISSSPIVGSGFGTFLPRYYIFDNEWVLITVELGILGVLAFGFVVVSAIWSGMTARTRSTDPGTRLLGYALAAAVVNISVLFIFFDGLSFPQSGGMFFLIAGLCGAVRKIGASGAIEDDVRAATPSRRPATAGRDVRGAETA